MNINGKAEGLREQKKRITRQQLSNTATELFIKHGFDNVTITDIAIAANVSKMTVFNYFPRKEALYFDRIDEIHQLLQGAIDRHHALSPVAALRTLAAELVEQEHPLVRMDEGVADFWRVVAESPSLRVYALEQFEILVLTLSNILSSRINAQNNDPAASLIAVIVLNTWRIAFQEALSHQTTLSIKDRRQVFLDLLERGFHAAEAAAQGTPYV
ncbi:TetR/AcrR family transcriptional regulator [Sodalis sp. RH14]|uniref:TetR/AcrR family transcriptional regulator n=1 Tax=Sodalis sp. RH14 TaxID=3394329 RepID=UPI0039B39EB2